MSYKYATKSLKDKSLSEEKKSLFCDFFLAMKKVYISRVGCSFYRILEHEPRMKRNRSKDDTKTQIVINRIQNLLLIIEDKITFRKIEAFYRVLMKSFMVKLLFTNDNYLQSHSNLELYRYRNFSAYLKIIYTIRLNSTRKFILRAYFNKLQNLITDFVPIKTFYLKKCVMSKVSRGSDFHYVYIKRLFIAWKYFSILMKPNPLLFDKERRNINIVLFILKVVRKVNYSCFNKLQRYFAWKENQVFLKQVNEDISSINSVVNYKRNLINPEKLSKATTIIELEGLYSNVYALMRENLTKEIKLYKNTSILKGLFYIISKQLVDKRISSRFSLWKSKVEYLKIQKINDKIHKYSVKKQSFSLILLEKIVQKIHILKLYWMNSFLERFTLFTKLKNTLKEYGYSYRKIPDILNQDEESKCTVLLIRETYTKLFRLMKVKVLLNRKRNIPYFDKYKNLVKPDFFKLNNTFLKWKKFTMISILRPFKITFAIVNIINLFRKKDYQIYWECFRRIANSPKINDTLCSEKETLLFVIKKIYNKAQLIDKSRVIDTLVRISDEKLRRRSTILKNYVMAKYYLERTNNRTIKFNWLRKWKNFNLKYGILFKGKSSILQQSNAIKTLFFFKKVEKTIKAKILRLIRSKISRYKLTEQPKKIDFYVNLNQAKACLELEKTEKELDKLYFQNRIKLFNTDTLCKLIYKKSIKEGKTNYFRKWRNIALWTKPVNESFINLLNERDILIAEKKELEVSLGEYTQQYEKVNEEYTEFQKIFCKNCLQVEENEIFENRSSKLKGNIKSQQFNSVLSKSNEFYVSNEDGEFIEPNKIVSSEQKLNEEVSLRKNDSSLKHKIVDIENKINSLKCEYDQKLQSNERFLRIYEEKKKELLSIKNEIMSKMSSSVLSKKQSNK